MKINHLLRKIPQGAVVTTSWLAAHQVSSDQARKLANSGWLQRVGHGAYCRAGDHVSWESGVFALQALCDPSSPSLWPGGQTALALQGFAHYLAMGQEVIHLFGTRGGRLPSWFHDAQWRDHTVLHTKRGLPENLPDSFTAYDPPRKGFTLQISTPERAILEWVAITPNELLFSDKMVDTFDGLNTLRPGRLQALLEGCRSVRAKRAFLVLARHAGHAWFDRLDQQRLDLGLGKRQLWPNGRLDKEYLVTIPERFAHER